MVEGLPTLRKARYAEKNGRVIGEGSYRVVYRARSSKWAYKFNLNPGSDLGSNAEEWKTYTQYKDAPLPAGVFFPEMHYLNGGVIATQFIKGTHPDNDCYREYHVDSCPGVELCWAERVKTVKVSDIHYQNVLVTDSGDIYLVDLGHGETYDKKVLQQG